MRRLLLGGYPGLHMLAAAVASIAPTSKDLKLSKHEGTLNLDSNTKAPELSRQQRRRNERLQAKANKASRPPRRT